MSEWFSYTKKRRELGKPPRFVNNEGDVVTIDRAATSLDNYARRDPNFITLDNIPEFSEHSVNTERVSTTDRGMAHKEGGWSTQWDYTDPNDRQKWKKKIDKDQVFAVAVKELTRIVSQCIDQNNQIDLFEEYFVGEEPEHFVENITTKTLMLFKDKNSSVKRAVGKISWHPEGPIVNKIAVSYTSMRFGQTGDKMPNHSSIWDLQNPNIPDKTLNSPSPVYSLAYNHKMTDVLAGGCHNGLIAIWDLRNKEKQSAINHVLLAQADKTHYDPVTDLKWLSSKTGSEFVTTSTDGRVLWWDTRRPDEGPTQVLTLTENITGSPDSKAERVVGGTAIEYVPDAGPMKYLVGTEQGSVLTANKRPGKNVEISHRYGIESGRHYGPIYALQRNPMNLKYFMTVGDWSVKIWNEELRIPMIRTRYHGSYVTDGCWSPTRQGVFFVSRKDGLIDIWDYFYRQNEIAYSHKISEHGLTCVRVNTYSGQQQSSSANTNSIVGKLLAIGDAAGTVTMLELPESLYMLQNKEKDVINEMFEREYKKEKETLRKATEAQKKPKPEAFKADPEEKKKEVIKKVEEEFYKIIGQAGLDDGGEVGAHSDDEDDEDGDAGSRKKNGAPKQPVQQQQSMREEKPAPVAAEPPKEKTPKNEEEAKKPEEEAKKPAEEPQAAVEQPPPAAAAVSGSLKICVVKIQGLKEGVAEATVKLKINGKEVGTSTVTADPAGKSVHFVAVNEGDVAQPLEVEVLDKETYIGGAAVDVKPSVSAPDTWAHNKDVELTDLRDKKEGVFGSLLVQVAFIPEGGNKELEIPAA